jgi:S1-C subfamily serine protease
VSMFCNKLLDMAIIRLEEGHYNFISIDINRKYPEVGEPIEIYGYPMGSVICDDVINLNLSLTRGYVSSNQVFEKLRRVFIDGDARHGNSGGPIVSMETGKVIGMLHGSIVTAQSEYDVDNICYTIPIKYLKTYFIMANEGK